MANKKISDEIYHLLRSAKEDCDRRSFEASWLQLAEAHILSQPFAILHMIVHWHMLLLAFKEKNFSEIGGQLIRLIVAGPGSLTKRYPLGNSGRSHVNMFLPQDIPLELKKKIEQLNQ